MFSESYLLSSSLVSLGYRDYIAGRLLFNNEFYSQAIVLASSSIEKYLKAILATQGVKCKVHLDKLNVIKKAFENTPNKGIFDKLDEHFLDILGKAYKYRYYDYETVKQPDHFSFLINQFLCELDYTVGLIEKSISFKVDDKIAETHYQKAIKEKNPHLFLNNYLLNKIPKKEFMERESKLLGIYVDPSFLGVEISITAIVPNPKYNGSMIRMELTSVKEGKKT